MGKVTSGSQTSCELLKHFVAKFSISLIFTHLC